MGQNVSRTSRRSCAVGIGPPFEGVGGRISHLKVEVGEGVGEGGQGEVVPGGIEVVAIHAELPQGESGLFADPGRATL